MAKEKIMSNSELKEGQEVWIKVMIEDNRIDIDGEIRVKTPNGWDCWEKPEDIITVIPEKQELSKIPQYVADKIEYCKKSSDYKLFHAMDYCFQFKDSSDWLECNEETFAKAWFYGYEVVQEKLYYISIPNAYQGDFGYHKKYENYSFYNKSEATDVRFELTEEEINKNHKSLKNFAKEVEE